MLMVNKTTSFKKKGKGKKGNFKKNGKEVVTPSEETQSLDPSLRLSASTARGTGHWKRNCPKYLADKKDGNSEQRYI